MSRAHPFLIAIACGGTGGHLFPGLAVARELEAMGAETRLFVSEKEIDQVGTREVPADQVIALPAIGLDRRRLPAFFGGFARSFWRARRALRANRPAAVLGMGGFTSAPPVLAARLGGAQVFLHEANSVPGRANRWLSWLARETFVFFPSAARGLRRSPVRIAGMPIRERIRPLDPAACRERLGLAPDRPTLLIMGGSQGAAGLNDAFLRALPLLHLMEPALQFVHLTGDFSYETVVAAYAQPGLVACVRPFLAEMEVALSAADLAISRAGASSLAELAATRVPPILIPYPAAAQNHQVHNARQFAESGAARVIPQAEAAPERLLWEIRGLVRHAQARLSMADALTRRHPPDAAKAMAGHILAALGQSPEPVEPPLVTRSQHLSAP